MREPLLKIENPKVLQSGVVKSQHPLRPLLWLDSSNVDFEDGVAKKSKGFSAAFPAPQANSVCGLQSLRKAGVQHLFIGYADKLYTYNTAGNPVQTGSGYTGIAVETVNQRKTLWSMSRWGNWCVACNGLDTSVVDKIEGSGFVTLTDAPVSEIFIKRGAYMLAFNTALGTDFMQWCDDDNIEDWTNGDAGNIQIRDLDSEIIAAVKLGSHIAVYSKDSMVVVSYVGAPFIFGYNPALEGIGAVSKHSVVSVGRKNYGFSAQGIWETDGVSFRYIESPDIIQWIDDNVDKDKLSHVVGYWNVDRKRLEWSVPLIGGGSQTIGYNHENGAWSFHSVGFSIAIKRGVFANPVVGLDAGDVYFANYGLGINGASLPTTLTTKPLHFGDTEYSKYIDALKILVSNLKGNFYVTIGTQDFIDEAVVWGTQLTINDGMQYLHERVSSPYVTLKFTSSNAVGDWSLAGFYIFGDIDGSDR